VIGLLKNAKPVLKSELPATSIPVIKIEEAGEGETLQSIIDRTDSKDYNDLIVLINEKTLSGSFKEGQLVKTIVKKSVSFN
jgi:hypothetical protein